MGLELVGTSAMRTMQDLPSMPRQAFRGWSINEGEFPQAGSAVERLRFLLGYGVLAPSVYNSQPWRFAVGADSIEVCADRMRALPAADPHGRALIQSCGAVIENLSGAGRYFGYRVEVEPFPDPVRPELVARLRFAAGNPPDAAERAQFRSLTQTWTGDLPFDPDPPSPALQSGLQQAARERGCTLAFIKRATARLLLRELVIDAERAQHRLPAVVAERRRWIRQPGENALDGISPEAAGDAPVPARELGIPPWSMDIGRSGVDAHLDQLAARVDAAPLLAVLATRHDAPRDWLAAGRGWQHLALEARGAGLWLSPLNAPVRVPAVRRRLRGLLPTRGWAQAVVALGFGSEIQAPRRRAPQAWALSDAPALPH